ncbi:MAG: hypothetical protein CMP91_00760 [Gammaproteobacteria bacterium]|nr:hypothetical protein [Gammaproteobacteria bacterium]|tara:strand:- start:98898 stop:99320 length:423 start_codon:yes stop_codon:yes gene_type:complete
MNNKTRPGHTTDVKKYLASLDNAKRRSDAEAVLELMQEITGQDACMWGASMIGFGSYHYKYDSGREGDWFVTGLAPRKQQLVVYIMSGLEKYPQLLEKLGRFKTGKSCLYISKLEDINVRVLGQLIRKSVADMRKNYACQ